MIKAYAELFAMVILTSASQVLIKIGSGKLVTGLGIRRFMKSMLNPYVIFGFALIVAAPVLYFLALSQLPLNTAYSISGLSYILVMALGRIVLREKLSVFHFIGGALILSGIMFWNYGSGLL